MDEIDPQDTTIAAAMPFVPFIQQMIDIYKSDTDPCVAAWIKEVQPYPLAALLHLLTPSREIYFLPTTFLQSISKLFVMTRHPWL